MARLIFYTMMSLFIGSITLGLAGCVTDGGYDGYQGSNHHKNWRERAFERNGGGARLNGTPEDVLAGGFGG